MKLIIELSDKDRDIIKGLLERAIGALVGICKPEGGQVVKEAPPPAGPDVPTPKRRPVAAPRTARNIVESAGNFRVPFGPQSGSIIRDLSMEEIIENITYWEKRGASDRHLSDTTKAFLGALRIWRNAKAGAA